MTPVAAPEPVAPTAPPPATIARVLDLEPLDILCRERRDTIDGLPAGDPVQVPGGLGMRRNGGGPGEEPSEKAHEKCPAIH